MRISSPGMKLTSEEARLVVAVLQDEPTMNALRKVFAEESHFWRTQSKGEALKPDPSAFLLVNYAAREETSERFEQVIRKAAGL